MDRGRKSFSTAPASRGWQPPWDTAPGAADRRLSVLLRHPDRPKPPDPRLTSARPFAFQALDDITADAHPKSLESLEEVELDLRIELGRAELLIEEVLKLREGSVVPLDKLAGDPVDILVNGRLVARGEVLVLNDNFCVRVAEILAPQMP